MLAISNLSQVRNYNQSSLRKISKEPQNITFNGGSAIKYVETTTTKINKKTINKMIRANGDFIAALKSKYFPTFRPILAAMNKFTEVDAFELSDKGSKALFAQNTIVRNKPIHIAKNGFQLRFVLLMGANVNGRNSLGLTRLCMAQSLSEAKFLVKKGARVLINIGRHPEMHPDFPNFIGGNVLDFYAYRYKNAIVENDFKKAKTVKKIMDYLESVVAKRMENPDFRCGRQHDLTKAP